MILLSLLLSSNMAWSAADPLQKQQWGINNSGSPQTIELDHITVYRVQGRAGEDLSIPASLKKPNKKVIVAVLDTGIDKTHPDIQGVLHRNESECKALKKFEECVVEKDRKTCEAIWFDPKNPEVDQDKNGYPLDCSGWTILGGTNSRNIMGRPDFGDEQGHGTHVAGIIGAANNNGIGIRGVSPHVEILPVQVLGVKPSEPIKPLSLASTPSQVVPPANPPGMPPKPTDPLQGPLDLSPDEKGKEPFRKTLGDLVARGVIYAIHSGAEVINFSLGWPESNDSPYLRKVIEEAQKRGIIIVAAAGNDSTRALLRPCVYPGVICVASHGPDGSLSHFSNYGSGVDVAAPGTQILSTYPMQKRPVRFRNDFGYEFLHGTSQASPYIAGLVAEMIAQGVPKKEIYSRLVLGARPLKEKLPLLEGAAHDLKEDMVLESSQVEKRFVLSGLADLSRSLSLTPRPLLLPASKEKLEIPWNLNSRTLTAKFAFKNHWQAVDMKEVAVSGRLLKPNNQAVRPEIRSLRFTPNTGVWKEGEVRQLEVQFEITDANRPRDSRIPSELDLELSLSAKGEARRLVLESEIVVPLGDDFQSEDVESIPVLNMPQLRTSLIAIDENLDGVPRSDYLALAVERGTHQYFLVRQNSQKAYESQAVLKLQLGEDSEKTTEQVLARIPSESGSRYVIGLFIDRSEDEKAFSALRLYQLDQNFKQIRNFEIINEKVQIPSRVYWQAVNGNRVPSWVGRGYIPDKKRSVRDDWENPQGREVPKIRFYYMDIDNKLKAISEHQGYEFMDVLEPSLSQNARGIVPVLLAKNRGTVSKPSYLYDFAVGEIQNGKIISFKDIDLTMNRQIYRNLLDTRVDKVQSLDRDLEFSRGTFWFGEGPARSQRLSMLVPDQNFRYFDFFDLNLSATRGKVDSTLWVRSAFFGKNQAGVFALTNSEIQYHDILNSQVVVRSLERYTFHADMMFTNLHFPMTLVDSKNPKAKIPALFTTENSGLSRGVRFKAAVSDERGRLVEIISPAKLRFKSAQGCKPLDNPVVTEDGASALDYYCGQKILRMRLEY